MQQLFVKRPAKAAPAYRKSGLDRVAEISVSYTHLDVYKRQMVGSAAPTTKRPALPGTRWCIPAAPCPCAPINPCLLYTSLHNPIIMVILATVVVIGVLYWFFGTELGCGIRATGSNPAMSRAQGDVYKRQAEAKASLKRALSCIQWARNRVTYPWSG